MSLKNLPKPIKIHPQELGKIQGFGFYREKIYLLK
jgi:hypothetical protein